METQRRLLETAPSCLQRCYTFAATRRALADPCLSPDSPSRSGPPRPLPPPSPPMPSTRTRS
eukprot:6216638-Alexandrium_andersonii.AAC.1